MGIPDARRRSPEERTGQILDAAVAVFGEQGLAGARIDDIADRAGISKGTVYLYFPSKDELFRGVIRRAYRDIVEAIADVPQSSSARAHLSAFCERYWSVLRSAGFEIIYRLIMAEIHAFPELSQEYSETVREPVKVLLAGILTRGVASGEFRAGDNTVRARMLLALLWQHGIWCARRAFNPDIDKRSDDDVLREVVTFFLEAVSVPQ